MSAAPSVRILTATRAIPALGIAAGDKVVLCAEIAVLNRVLPLEVAQVLGALPEFSPEDSSQGTVARDRIAAMVRTVQAAGARIEAQSAPIPAGPPKLRVLRGGVQ